MNLVTKFMLILTPFSPKNNYQCEYFSCFYTLELQLISSPQGEIQGGGIRDVLQGPGKNTGLVSKPSRFFSVAHRKTLKTWGTRLHNNNTIIKVIINTKLTDSNPGLYYMYMIVVMLTVLYTVLQGKRANFHFFVVKHASLCLITSTDIIKSLLSFFT